MPDSQNLFLGFPGAKEDTEERLARAVQWLGMTRSRGWLDTEFAQPSQAELAGLTSMAPSSVSALARTWRDQRLVPESSSPHGLAFSPNTAIAFGVDISFSKLRVAVADLHGQLMLAPVAKPQQFGENGDGALDWLVKNLRDLHSKALQQVPNARIAGVGVSIDGPVDRESGKLRKSLRTASDWHFLGVIEQLRQRLAWDTNFTIDRDANTAAIAEAAWGAARALPDTLYVKWSDGGVSAALLLGRQLHRGSTGMAGEIGHAIIRLDDDDNPRLKKWLELRVCPHCGRPGCIETVTSLDAFRAFLDNPTLEAEDVIGMAREGDDDARFAVQAAAQCLGRVLAPVVDVLNPALVVIGGKTGANSYPLVTRTLNDSLRERAVTPAVESVDTAGGSPHLTPDTAIRGAIALALVEGLPELVRKA